MAPNPRDGDDRSHGDRLLTALDVADLARAAGVDLATVRSTLSGLPTDDVDPEAVRAALETAAEEGVDLASEGGEVALEGGAVAAEGAATAGSAAVEVAAGLADVAGGAEAALDLLELLDF